MTAKQTTREVSAVTYICDKCGEEIKYDFFHPSPCCVCKRHFHAVKCDPGRHVDGGGGDYPDVYCSQCWAIGEPFRKRIEENEQTIDREREGWYKLARESVK